MCEIGYIYKIENIITNKIYIGQTTNPKARWSKHKSIARNVDSINYKSHLYSAMNKYGIDKFSFEIIEECDYSILDEREYYWIKKLNTLEPNGYNIRSGGEKLKGKDNPFYGKHHSEETKEKISKKNTGRKASVQEIEKRKEINKGIQNPFYGRHHSKETKEKIKATCIKKGIYQKASERMKINNPNDGSSFKKAVLMLDKNFNVLNIFDSATQAGEEIKKMGLSKAKYPGNSISEVCRGEQKTAFGFYWRYFNPTLKTNLNTKITGFIIERREKNENSH